MLRQERYLLEREFRVRRRSDRYLSGYGERQRPTIIQGYYRAPGDDDVYRSRTGSRRAGHAACQNDAHACAVIHIMPLSLRSQASDNPSPTQAGGNRRLHRDLKTGDSVNHRSKNRYEKSKPGQTEEQGVEDSSQTACVIQVATSKARYLSGIG